MSEEAEQFFDGNEDQDVSEEHHEKDEDQPSSSELVWKKG
jgi:hypothetical protein